MKVVKSYALEGYDRVREAQDAIESAFRLGLGVTVEATPEWDQVEIELWVK